MNLKRPSGQTVSDILGKDMATIARELNEPGVHNELKLNGVELNINEIIIRNRKRQADENKVIEIMESIKEIGLLNPISINKAPEGYVLVAGLHRLTAYKNLGYNRIQAVIVDMDDIHSELAEIDENLIRAELHYLDRAELLKRRQEIYEELHPEATKSEKVKKNLKQFNTENDTMSFSDGSSNDTALDGEKNEENLDSAETSFVSDTAKKTGLSERTVQRDLQLAKNLDEGAKKQIKKKKISKGDALKIAREKKENQQKAVKDLTEKPKPKNAGRNINDNVIPGAPPYEQMRNQMPGETTKAVIDDFYGKTPNTENHKPEELELGIDEFIERFNALPGTKNIKIIRDVASLNIDETSIIITANDDTLKKIIGSLGVIFNREK